MSTGWQMLLTVLTSALILLALSIPSDGKRWRQVYQVGYSTALACLFVGALNWIWGWW